MLVCIGNPPYDRQVIEPGDLATDRKGGWVRFGDPKERAILDEGFPGAGSGGRRGGHLRTSTTTMYLALGAVETLRFDRRARHCQLHHRLVLPPWSRLRGYARVDEEDLR